MMVRCPHCSAMTVYEGNPHRPFCSERCKNADLHQWLVPPKDDEEDSQPPPRQSEDGW